MKAPVFGRVLHDEKRVFGIRPVIVPSLSRSVSMRQSIEQVFAIEEGLLELENAALAAKLDTELFAYRTRSPVATDQV